MTHSIILLLRRICLSITLLASNDTLLIYIKHCRASPFTLAAIKQDLIQLSQSLRLCNSPNLKWIWDFMGNCILKRALNTPSGSLNWHLTARDNRLPKLLTRTSQAQFPVWGTFATMSTSQESKQKLRFPLSAHWGSGLSVHSALCYQWGNQNDFMNSWFGSMLFITRDHSVLCHRIVVH